MISNSNNITYKMEMLLPKIGPGLGSRKRIWSRVKSRILREKKQSIVIPLEFVFLTSLSTGMQWLEMIPKEWRDIYGALHDESSQFTTSQQESTKIDKDVHRTFSLFTRNARQLRLQFNNVDMNCYMTALRSLLLAVSHGRGYCQGINFLAAVFLLQEGKEKDAYILLSFLLRQRYVEILYNPKSSSLLEYMSYFEKRLRRHNRRVYRHFKEIDFGPICFAVEWFTTCFVVTCPGELSSCAVDLLLVGCEDIMIRVGLAILDHLEPQLLALDLESTQLQLKHLAAAADPYDVMYRALTIPIHSNTRRNILQTMALNIEAMSPRSELVNTVRGHCLSSTPPASHHIASVCNLPVTANTDCCCDAIEKCSEPTVTTTTNSTEYLSQADDECPARPYVPRPRHRQRIGRSKQSRSTSSQLHSVGPHRTADTAPGAKTAALLGRKHRNDMPVTYNHALATKQPSTGGRVNIENGHNAVQGRPYRRGPTAVLTSASYESLVPVNRIRERSGFGLDMGSSDLSDWEWDHGAVTAFSAATAGKTPVDKSSGGEWHGKPVSSPVLSHVDDSTALTVARSGHRNRNRSLLFRTNKTMGKTPAIDPATTESVVEAPVLFRSKLLFPKWVSARRRAATLAASIAAAKPAIESKPNPTATTVKPNSAATLWLDKIVRDAVWWTTLGLGESGKLSTVTAYVPVKSTVPTVTTKQQQGGSQRPGSAHRCCPYDGGDERETGRKAAGGSHGGHQRLLRAARRHSGAPPVAARAIGESRVEGDGAIDLSGVVDEEWFATAEQCVGAGTDIVHLHREQGLSGAVEQLMRQRVQCSACNKLIRQWRKQHPRKKLVKRRRFVEALKQQARQQTTSSD